jgi:hypothetical protein
MMVLFADGGTGLFFNEWYALHGPGNGWASVTQERPPGDR